MPPKGSSRALKRESVPSPHAEAQRHQAIGRSTQVREKSVPCPISPWKSSVRTCSGLIEATALAARLQVGRHKQRITESSYAQYLQQISENGSGIQTRNVLFGTQSDAVPSFVSPHSFNS